HKPRRITEGGSNLGENTGSVLSDNQQAVRKIIYTTNAIESLNRVIRKTTKTRGSFPTDDAATKLIYLAIRSFEKTGRAVREWVAARNQFAILYPERFNI
ncbi:transposase, partial [Sulfitobacter sp. 1A15106]|uniref:transposase n=1 Tax=Sulfitobacter sp. 1A15106 TaxID=3368590 RepID=UPI003745A90F